MLETGILLLLLIISGLFVNFQIRGSHSFAPWVPSHTGLLKKVLSQLPLQGSERFLDLGCGDGRAVFLAAEKFKLQATGIELSPLLWLVAELRRLFSPAKKNVTFLRGDLYNLSLKEYQLIYLYGLPSNINSRLKEKIAAEAAPGTMIISYNFSLEQRQPIIEMRDKWRTIRVYKI